MGYTITVSRLSRSYLIYDYAQPQTYPASNIRLSTGNSEVGTLTFTIPYDHPSKSVLQLRDNAHGYRVFMRHSHGSRSSLLFVGTVVAMDTDIQGSMTVTCKDELESMNKGLFRLSDSGYQLENANIEQLMPRIMTLFGRNVSGFNGYGFIISECRVLSSSQDGDTQEGVVLPDGTATNPEYLFPDSRHQFEPDKVRSFLSILKDMADSIGAVVYLAYSGSNLTTRSLVFDARTSDADAHEYSYGKDLVEASVWYDTNNYYNGAYATGGMRRIGPTDIQPRYTIVAEVDEAAPVGASSLYMHWISGPTQTINNEYVIMIRDGANSSQYEYNWYDVNVESDVTLGTTYEQRVEVGIGGAYLQREIAAGKRINIYAKANVSFIERVTTPGFPMPSGYRRINYTIANDEQVNAHALRVFEYNSSNVISPYLLSQRAAAEIEKKISISRNVDARFLGIEVTHDYTETDESSHTMVGDVVHITHEKLGIDDDFQVKGMSVNVDDPTQNSYTLGVPRPSITRAIAEAEKSASDKIYDTRRQ